MLRIRCCFDKSNRCTVCCSVIALGVQGLWSAVDDLGFRVRILSRGLSVEFYLQHELVLELAAATVSHVTSQ